MSTMTARFHRGRWSETRKQIDAMAPGDSLTFTEGQYFNAKASVERLNDAYAGMKIWSLSLNNKAPTVTRTK